MYKKSLSSFVLAIAACLASGPSAFAATDLLTSATRANNYTNTSTSLVAVPLNDAGVTAIQFTTKVANEKVRIIYNAECGVLGPGSAWLTAEVTVDGALTAPASGTLFALCTATSTTNYSWMGAVRQAIYRVPTPGLHTLQVLAAGQNGATAWWLGDTSIVVDQ